MYLTVNLYNTIIKIIPIIIGIISARSVFANSRMVQDHDET